MPDSQNDQPEDGPVEPKGKAVQTAENKAVKQRAFAGRPQDEPSPNTTLAERAAARKADAK